MNQRIEELLGFKFDEVEICPHRPEDACRCRKPSAYMLSRIIQGLECGTLLSFYAGDKRTDIEAGINAGLKTIWCNFGQRPEEDSSDIADHTVTSFSQILNFLDTI